MKSREWSTCLEPEDVDLDAAHPPVGVDPARRGLVGLRIEVLVADRGEHLEEVPHVDGATARRDRLVTGRHAVGLGRADDGRGIVHGNHGTPRGFGAPPAPARGRELAGVRPLVGGQPPLAVQLVFHLV
nr:hypothetical protein [Candidatus Sigynarchaeota archaeon]